MGTYFQLGAALLVFPTHHGQVNTKGSRR